MGEIKQPRRVIIMLLCEKLGKLHGVTRFVLNFGGRRIETIGLIGPDRSRDMDTGL